MARGAPAVHRAGPGGRPSRVDDRPGAGHAPRVSISADLLEKLCCPKCRGALALLDGERGLACSTCDLLYEIVDGIPNLLVPEAKPLGRT